MLLKRIHAPSLPEALAKVERECGKNALLVDTRPSRDGYTIVAAREEDVVRAPRTGSPSAPRWTRGFAPIADRATRFGLGANVLKAVERALIGTRVHLDRPGDPALERLTAQILKSLIKTRPFDLPRFHATALVGPTGVGKTTTLAKLAARCVNECGESVTIVTTDTYRIAGCLNLNKERIT